MYSASFSWDRLPKISTSLRPRRWSTRQCVRVHRSRYAQPLTRMFQAVKCLQQVRNAFTQTDGAGKENLEAIGRRRADGAEAVELDAIGHLDDLLGGDAHLDERSPGKLGGHSNSVGHLVFSLLTQHGAFIADDGWEAPMPMFFADERGLIANMGRAAVADIFPTPALHETSGVERGIGQTNHNVTGFDPGSDPVIEPEVSSGNRDRPSFLAAYANSARGERARYGSRERLKHGPGTRLRAQAAARESLSICVGDAHVPRAPGLDRNGEILRGQPERPASYTSILKQPVGKDIASSGSIATVKLDLRCNIRTTIVS